jgi:uncharacterized protein (TIGR02001 family)
MKIRFLGAVAAMTIGFASEAAFADDPAAAAPAPEFTVTGDAAIVSQYKFRGLTQSDSKPAVQAAFTVSEKSGFYLSFWGSSGSDHRDDDRGNSYISPSKGTEIDVYGGYTHSLAASGITLDGGVYGYIYPSVSADNYFEVYGDVSKSYGPISVKAGVNWAPKQNVFTTAGTATQYSMYEYGEISYTPINLPALNFHSHLGHTGGGLDLYKEYIDYTVGVGYRWKALTFDISAVGTNITHNDVAKTIPDDEDNRGNEINRGYRYGKLAPVASITASF